MDRGLAYGEACFETFRVIDGEVFLWQKHMQRLAAGLSEFGIVLSKKQLQEIRECCLAKAEATGADVRMRLTVSGGLVSWGLLPDSRKPACYLQAMRMNVSRHKSVSLLMKPWPFPLQEKVAKLTSDYANILRALKGIESTDVLFSHQEYLLAAATANVLLYREGQWWTPAGPGVLGGIVRGYLIDAGLVTALACPVDWLDDCEALVLSNCGSFLQPVAEVVFASQRWHFDELHPAIRKLSESLAGQPGIPAKLLP